MSTIIIGAGIIGLHIAEALSSRGEHVTVVDSSIPGHGTTSTSFAWVNANQNLDPAYFAIKAAGMEEHRRYAQRHSGEQTYFETGGIQFTDEANEAWVRDNVKRLASLGYAAEWLTVNEACDLEHLSHVPSDTTHVARFKNEGYILPCAHVSNLAHTLQSRGVDFITDIAESIAVSPQSATAKTKTGRTLNADRLVLATGRWTKQLAATAGFNVPMITDLSKGSPLVGVLGVANTMASPVEQVVHSPGLNLRPSSSGRVIMQALDLNTAFDPHEPEKSSDEIRSQLAQRFKHVTNQPLDPRDIDIRLSLRSLPVDGHPIVGFLDPYNRIYTSVTHGGITLGPLLGRLVTEELLDHSRDPLLGTFVPDRFTSQYLKELHPYAAPSHIGQQ